MHPTEWLGRYTSLERLGGGASAEVWAVRDRFFPDRQTALKRFSAEVPLRAVEREFKQLSALYHPHLIAAYDCGQLDDGRAYLTSARVEAARDLKTALRGKPISFRLRILAELALTLDFVHERGILHGDLKPENILCPHGKAEHFALLDFGMARPSGKDPPHKLPQGTLTYLAPECLKGETADGRSDLYAWGILAWEILFASLPMKNPHDPDAIVRFHLYDSPTLPSHPKLPPGIGRTLLQTLAKSPHERPERGRDLAKGISQSAGIDMKALIANPLSGPQRDLIRRTITRFVAELEPHLKKTMGPVPAGIWAQEARELARYEQALAHAKGKEWDALKAELAYVRARLCIKDGKYRDALAVEGTGEKLKNAHGLAHFYLGDYRAAERAFHSVLEIKTAAPLAQGSAENYLGMSAYNQKQFDEALTHYRRALPYFEKERDTSGLCSVFLNVGAAEQEKGDYAGAIAAYETALNHAKRGRYPFLAGSLLNNLANLHIRFGAAELAARFLKDSRKIADQSGFPYLDAYNELIAGDLHLLKKAFRRADAAYARAQEKFTALHMTREADIARANRAECAALDPKQSAVEGQTHPESPEEEDPVKLAAFKKLLEVNQRMIAEHALRPLLEFIMDTVIELGSAERGFLILAEKKSKDLPFKITVARNLDQEIVQKPVFKVSRTLIEKVLAGRKPMLITDAESDPRLKGAKSVQALKLKSLLCVPLLNRQKLIGAIYLENRFHKGIFTADHVEILAAFADQAALAIENTRLYEENLRQRDEIAGLNERLESTVARQTLKIEDLHQKIDRTQQTLERRYEYKEIAGKSPAMERIFAVLDRVTDRNISVLITGESGTGKELIARALHYNGPRRSKNFVAVNCAAIPHDLLESELFGFARGAFTGADRDRTGLFEQADGGTLFLDEIGDMPLSMQAKLLRVIETQEVRPLGSSRRMKVDVRIVSATHQDLLALSKSKHFRADLYYRLSGISIPLPPLRERKEDIPLVIAHLLRDLDPSHAHPLTPEALSALMQGKWPGNVRELRHELERALVLAEGPIAPEHLSEKVLGIAIPRLPIIEGGGTIRAYREAAEREAILQALREKQGNKSKAAQSLGISRIALYQKLGRLKISA